MRVGLYKNIVQCRILHPYDDASNQVHSNDTFTNLSKSHTIHWIMVFAFWHNPFKSIRV